MIGAMITLTRLITLIIGLSAGPAVSFSGSPTVSPTTLALWRSEPLPGVLGQVARLILDQLLGIVPCATGGGHEDRQQLAGEDDAGQEAAQGLHLQRQADHDRRDHRQQAPG